VSAPVTVGFGDASLAGVVRGDGGGGLLCRDGRTTVLGAARVEASDGPGGPSWRASEGGELDVVAEPLGGPAIFADGTREWLCRVRGTVAGAELDGLGHAVVEAPAPRSRKRVELARGVSAWPEAHPIDDPRLSTAYDGAGHQRRAGLELWETDESDYPLRVAGEAVGAGELELDGGGRLRCAFFVWRHAGSVGGGRYDILLAGD
jgi:hypothetical protein